MGDGAAAAPPAKKNLPFKPTALRKAASNSKPDDSVKNGKRREGSDDEDDDGLGLFRQSKEMESIVAAERARKLRKKQKQAEERRRSDTAGRQILDSDEDGPSSLPVAAETTRATPVDESLTMDGNNSARKLATPPSSKRSRGDSEQASRSSKRHRSVAEPLDDDPFNDSPSQSTLPKSNTTSPSKRSKKQSVTPIGAQIISLDSDSDSDGGNDGTDAPESGQREDSIETVCSDVIGAGPSSVTPKPQAVTEIEDDDDDDEFAEFVRQAKEQRARNKAMMQMDSDKAARKDAAADILIRSNIPGTKVVIMKYQYDRPIRLIRDSWFALQGRNKQLELPVASAEEIVLTWRRRMVYMYSSLLGQGIRPQGDGKIITDEYAKGGLQDGRTKVVFEAWTTEGFRQMEREEERRMKREAGELSDDETTREEQVKETKLRVVLKAKDIEAVKLTVRLETTVETLIVGFRTQRNVSSSKDVGIWFDGDRLEEHQTMEDIDINDMDTLEVHIK
ncbi:ubiquitin-2 like Rad60 SUMO-like domain-containing protein [Trichoderma austrokoningii]